MSIAGLMSDLARLGVRLESRDDRLRYSPLSAVTPEIVLRMKKHRDELLSIVKRDLAASAIQLADPTSTLKTSHKAEPVFVSFGKEGWPNDCISPDEVKPCPLCNGLESWQSVVGDLSGVAAGRWHCQKCEPPTAAERLREFVARKNEN